MAWSDVKPYFRNRLKALGYPANKEHYDGFNSENISATQLDKAFFIELTTIRGISNNQDCQVTEVGVKVNIFKAGYRKPKEKLEEAISEAQTVVEDFIKAENRLMAGEVWTVYFDSMGIVPLAESDDNSMIIELDLRVLVYLPTR